MSSDSSARLLVSCGSLLLQTGAVPEVIHADAALVADVTDELSTIRLGTPALPIALARGQTTATLLVRACSIQPEFQGFRDALLALGTVDLHDGLGMLACLGLAAGTVALHDDHVRARIDKDLVVPLLRLHNGTLRHIGIWALNSLAGGVGTLAGVLFASAAAACVRERCEAIIDVLSFQIGALTFLGLGDRILDNAAAGLIEQLALLTDRDRDPRESRQLVLAELPTVDCRGGEIASDRALRSALAVSLASAFAAGGVQQRIQTGRTNRALGMSLGGVALLRGDWFGFLPVEEIVACAAGYYLGLLEAADKAADHAPPHLEFVDTQVSAPLTSSAELTAQVLRSGVKPPAFEAGALAEARFATSVRIDGLPVERVVAGAVEKALAGDHPQAMRLLSAMSAAVRAGLAAERVSEARGGARAASRKRQLRAAITVLFSEGGSWAGAQRFFAGPRRIVERFAEALQSWREAQAGHALATARGSALEAAAAAIGAAIGRIQSILARLRAALEAIASPLSSKIFSYLALSEVSAGFLRCIVSGDIPLLRSQLARSVGEVTPEGLAYMVQAGSAQPVEIVARLASPALFSGPFWGGAEASAPPFFRAIVLPPLNPVFLQSLRDAALEAGLRCDLLAGDTIAGGAAVVGLDAYEVRAIAELFPAPYLSGLRQIAGSKSSLYPLGASARVLMARLLNGDAACA